MRFYCAKLLVKHTPPQYPQETLSGQIFHAPPIYKSLIPVGLAVFSTSGDKKYWLHLINTNEAFWWLVQFAQIPAERDALLRAINNAQDPLVVQYAECDCNCDVNEMLVDMRENLESSFRNTCRNLNIDVYSRN